MSLIYCNINNPYIFAEEWRFHPSFDRTPLRIIDTPDNTYFLVHQQIFKKNIEGYNFPSLTLFKFDKKNPENGITPLVKDVALTSADIRLADYSPKGDYLIIVYNDGGVDLIDKNNELTYVDKLKKYSVPGMDIVNSVTFEPSTGDAWVATDAGYMHINASSFTVEDIQVLGKAITAIGRFSNRTVALSDNSAWMATTDKPVEFSEFSKITNITSPSVLMPLSENCFGYIQGAPGTTRPLMVATYSGDTWKTKQLGSDNFYSLVANESLVSRYESNFIPNRDGFLCFSSSKAWQLRSPADGEEASAFSITLDQSPLTLGSWDFSDFWSYRDRGTFVPRHATYSADNSAVSATWSDISDPIRPNAPAAFICTHMSYSPTYGMLAMNHGVEYHFKYTGAMTPNLLSGVKNGNWTVYSQTYTIPTSIEMSEDLMNSYNEFYPIYNPSGFLLDPLSPSKIWVSSMFGGIFVMDMDDLKKDIIRWTTPKDPFVKFPGVIPSLPVSDWGSHCAFSPAAVDNEGNLFTLFYTRNQNEPLHLKYLTPVRIKTLYDKTFEEIRGEDVWNTIILPYTGPAQAKCKILPLRNLSDVNKLIILPCGPVEHPIIIYDHKGTLDDVTDDEYVEILGVIDQFGHRTEFCYIKNIVEDINTGRIILANNSYALVFKPENKITDGYISGENIGTYVKEAGVNIAEFSEINSVVFDEYGGLWAATNNDGLIYIKHGVSKKYCTENSRLPSDNLHGLCWDSQNKSLLISTQLGLIEIFPDIQTQSNEDCRISVNPQVITPDYNGNIRISNLDSNSEIIIKDKDNNVVRNLFNYSKRSIEWDLIDNNKKRIITGLYRIIVNSIHSYDIMIM